MLNEPATTAPVASRVIVYGTDGCSLTMLIRRHLEQWGVSYDFVDIDAHPDWTTKVLPDLRLPRSQAPSPVVRIDKGVLVEPHLAELRESLARAGLVGDTRLELLDICDDESGTAVGCAAGAD